jgi:hypothetical protein
LPTHPDRQTAFTAALRGGPLPAGLVARGDVARRVDVYRNNVTHSLTAALAARFPVVRRLVGDDFFRALARVHIDADPPRSPVLAEWGADFAAFLARFPPLAAYPYMPDVARVEHARGRAFHAADAPPLDPAELAGADPDRLRLQLHPSVTVLALDHPGATIWARNQPGAAAKPVVTGPEIALILRSHDYNVPVWVIGAGDAAMVDALRAGDTLAEAARRARTADADHDLQSLLVRLTAAGAFIQTEA